MNQRFPIRSKEFENRRVKLSQDSEIEPHEVLLDSLYQKREKESGFSGRKLEVPLLQKVLRGFFIFCFLIISALFIKTFQLQIIDGKKYLALAGDNKFITQQLQAERGVIYDRNLEQLVFNQPSFDLLLNVNLLPKSEDAKTNVLKEVAAALKKDVKDLEQKIKDENDGEILVAENLDHETLVLLESKINDLTGFQVKNNHIRYYKDSNVFSHLVGYTGKINNEEIKANPEVYAMSDYVGRTGVENFYEDSLRKNSGKMRVEKDVRGNVVAKEISQFPESGKSLVLWLDAGLQRKAQEELEKVLANIGGKKAVIVALDPNTGGVLALVSLPSFDNNLFQKGADQKALKTLLEDPLLTQPLFNRAISGGYLVGSTIKPLIASAALQEKIINPDKKINAGAYIEIPNRYDPEITYRFKDWAVHGWTDLRKAIAESSNYYFYTIGGGYQDQQGLGPTRIKKYLEFFGWSEKTGIDLAGETAGFIPNKDWKKIKMNEGWWDGDTYNLSIGQGFIQITPIEVARAFAAIANGGKLLSPQVVQKIVDTSESRISTSSLKIIKEMTPKIVRENFIDPQNLQIVREGMRQAVTGQNSPLASSISLNSLPVSSAAKTGTAELGGNRYNNWVTVFAPYEKPEIVLTVMIENIQGVQAAALPVAKAVLEWYFSK
ncbi:MAG: penicillin-binding protein 2 [bacterium]|nr:penicillin-binding protein 2 [bacterium]